MLHPNKMDTEIWTGARQDAFFELKGDYLTPELPWSLCTATCYILIDQFSHFIRAKFSPECGLKMSISKFIQIGNFYFSGKMADSACFAHWQQGYNWLSAWKQP